VGPAGIDYAGHGKRAPTSAVAKRTFFGPGEQTVNPTAVEHKFLRRPWGISTVIPNASAGCDFLRLRETAPDLAARPTGPRRNPGGPCGTPIPSGTPLPGPGTEDDGRRPPRPLGPGLPRTGQASGRQRQSAGVLSSSSRIAGSSRARGPEINITTTRNLNLPGLDALVAAYLSHQLTVTRSGPTESGRASKGVPPRPSGRRWPLGSPPPTPCRILPAPRNGPI